MFKNVFVSALIVLFASGAAYGVLFSDDFDTDTSSSVMISGRVNTPMTSTLLFVLSSSSFNRDLRKNAHSLLVKMRYMKEKITNSGVINIKIIVMNIPYPITLAQNTYQ